MTMKHSKSCSFRLSKIWTVPSTEQLFSFKAPESSLNQQQWLAQISRIKTSAWKILPPTWPRKCSHSQILMLHHERKLLKVTQLLRLLSGRESISWKCRVDASLPSQVPDVPWHCITNVFLSSVPLLFQQEWGAWESRRKREYGEGEQKIKGTEDEERMGSLLSFAPHC